MNTSLMEKIISIEEFATLPQAAIKVLNMLEDEDLLDLKELTKTIETDAALTIKLIKVANSPLFAIGKPISSVHHAILTLGLKRISNIVVGISIFSKFVYSSSIEIKNILEKYWKHTSSVAVVSKSLSKQTGLNFKDSEFLGGLLHDIGKIAMIQFDNLERYRNVIDLVENKQITDFAAEERVFDMTHCDIGCKIATQWKLPKLVSSIIAHHRNFEKADSDARTIVAIVNVANLLCDVWGNGFYEGTYAIQFDKLPEWQHICSVSKKDLNIEKITFELEKDYIEASQFISSINHS
jgi:putative nucleotidyltransferase with HDIG domain